MPPASPRQSDPSSKFLSLLSALEQQHAHELLAMQGQVDDLHKQLQAQSVGAATIDFGSEPLSPQISNQSNASTAGDHLEHVGAGATSQSSMLGRAQAGRTVQTVRSLRSLRSLRSHILSDDMALMNLSNGTINRVISGFMTGRKRHWRVQWIHRVVERQAFDMFSAMLIVLNAVLLGVDTNWHALNYDGDTPPPSLEYLEWACAVWFVLELCLRILGNGCFFFIGPEWMWNWFDVVVVVSAVTERVISLLTVPTSLATFTTIRVVRVLRVTRAVRIFRLFRFFQELRMMVMSILKSSPSLTWSFILLMTDMYLFSVFFTNNVSDHLKEQWDGARGSGKLYVQFGSILRTNYTLFQAIAGGISWGEVSDPLFAIHWTNGVVFVFYIFFTIFALTNIITGVFVDTALQSAQGDRDELVQAHLRARATTLTQAKRFFEEASDSGNMNFREFEAHLRNTKARAHLAAIGIEVKEARGLFRLLDVDEFGVVTIEDFIAGCMRLKGNAKSIDLATLMYENKRLHLQFNRVHKEHEHLMAKLSHIEASVCDTIAHRRQRVTMHM